MFKNKFFKKTIVFFGFMLVLIASVGWWLPRYLILEEGTSLKYKPHVLFECLLSKKLWQSMSTVNEKKLEIGTEIHIPLKMFSEAVVSEIIDNEFIEFISKSNDILEFTIEEEGESSWLNVTLEQDLGINPFNRVIQNWQRAEKENQLQQFLEFISVQQGDKSCIQ